jgi:predicted membrane protein
VDASEEHVTGLQAGKRVYWEGTRYRVAVWRMGAWQELFMALVAVEWVHGGICYRVEDWRVDVSTEFFTKL